VHLETFGVIPASVTYIGADAFYSANATSPGIVGSETLEAMQVKFANASAPAGFVTNWDRVATGSLNVLWNQ